MIVIEIIYAIVGIVTIILADIFGFILCKELLKMFKDSDKE